MEQYVMKVSKKEEGEYKEVGSVAVFYPLLSELGLDVAPTGKDEEGFPTYADERVQYVFDAVLAAVKATARNRLQSGTATLKEGNTIAETVEALLATGERSGEALKTRREYFASFKAWLPSLGKAAAFNTAIYDIVSNVKNIQYQTDARKEKLLALITDHAASLSAEDAARFERIIVQVGEACEAANPLDEA
jgi:hypothetical protein